MWDEEIVVLVTSLKKRILQGKEKTRFGRIAVDAAVPAYVKRIFVSRVEKLIREEAPFSIQATTHFEIRPEDIEKLQNKFYEVFKEVAAFTEKEVDLILREAFVLRLDYLVKPVDTMRRLLFETSKSVDVQQLHNLFGSLVKDLPYAESLIQECDRRKYRQIENETYSLVITEILHEMFNAEPISVLSRDFDVLTDFISETKGETVRKLDGSVLQNFLADRNLWNFRRAVDVEIRLGKTIFSKDDLEVTLKRYLEFKNEFSSEEKGEKASGSVEIKMKTAAPKEDKTEDTFSISEIDIQSIVPEREENSLLETETRRKDWDLDPVENKSFDQQPISEEPLAIIADVKDAEQDDENKVKPRPMRIIRREHKKEDSVEESLLGSEEEDSNASRQPIQRIGIKSFIEAKTEKVFIKKLFNGDQEAYRGLIEKLDEAESWRVAKILIDNELFKRDVDPFSREAIKLVDLVYSRYYPEEGVGGQR